ncbi:MAG: hypothetical protein KDA21_13460 [Phycisphaerales bacterium]|nr:hypothetical protein [Phycisphaerales bacterium]
MRQPNRPGWPVHLLALLILLGTTGLTMSIGLGARDSTHTMENVAIASAQETWLRWHDGDALSLYVSTNSEIRRIRKPPMLVWLDMAAWSDLPPAHTPPATLLYRARVVTVLLALVMVGSIYWCGNTLRGFRFALLAGLAGATTLLLQRQGRTASYDIHMAAWTALAAAGALHAIRPGREDRSRRATWVGWATCLLGLLLASYSKNPLPLALNAIPGLAAVILHHRTRLFNGLRLTLITALAGLGVGVWYWWVFRTFPETASSLQHELTQPRGDDAQPVWYYLGVFGLVAPWSLWLICGLIHPFTAGRRSAGGDGEPMRVHHVARWLPFIWFIAIFVLFSIPEAKQQRYILPIIPAAALLIANVWFDHERLSRRGERDRAIVPVIWIHWIGLLVASLAVVFLLGWPDWSASVINRISGEDKPPVYAGAGIVPAILIGGFLLLVAMLGLWFHRRWKPYRAALCCGVWSMAALGANWLGYSWAESGVHPLRAPTEALAADIGDIPIYELRTPDMDPRLGLLNEEFRFYLGRHIRRMALEDVAGHVDAGEDFFLLVRHDRIADTDLEALGLVFDREVRVDKRQKMTLWRPAPATIPVGPESE